MTAAEAALLLAKFWPVVEMLFHVLTGKAQTADLVAEIERLMDAAARAELEREDARAE